MGPFSYKLSLFDCLNYFENAKNKSEMEKWNVKVFYFYNLRVLKTYLTGSGYSKIDFDLSKISVVTIPCIN